MEKQVKIFYRKIQQGKVTTLVGTDSFMLLKGDTVIFSSNSKRKPTIATIKKLVMRNIIPAQADIEMYEYFPLFYLNDLQGFGTYRLIGLFIVEPAGNYKKVFDRYQALKTTKEQGKKDRENRRNLKLGYYME
jgi:hypothetical protein